MAKFKVGDRVRIRNDLIVGKKYGSNGFIKDMYPMLGKIVTIKSVHEDTRDYRIEEFRYWWTDEMFEPAPFTKADLKDGMVVELRNYPANPYLMVTGDWLKGLKAWDKLSSYNDDLTLHTNYSSTARDALCIDKVYTTCGHTLEESFDPKYLTLIWERPKEEHVKEMTIEEIEKLVGCKVKVVGEKNG